jgi:hypothetical protein
VDLADARAISGWPHAAAVRSLPVHAARHKPTTIEEEEEGRRRKGGRGGGGPRGLSAY